MLENFSLGELEKDMAQLRNNLKEVERELEFHRVQPVVPGDRFLPVMKEFLATATCRFSELEDLFQDMKTRVIIKPHIFKDWRIGGGRIGSGLVDKLLQNKTHRRQ